MNETRTRTSPVHDRLDRLGPKWGAIGDAPVALRFGTLQSEKEAMRRLGLCDLSAMVKLGLKGPRAASWLEAQGVDLPNEVYETRRLSGGGLVVRLGADEFLLESGVTVETVNGLRDRFGPSLDGAYRVERKDATFLLSGSRAVKVMEQTCGVDFARAATDRLVMTRVAGVSCGVLPQEAATAPVYRLWVDPSDAAYLWDELAQILGDLGGAIVGAACHHEELETT